MNLPHKASNDKKKPHESNRRSDWQHK